VISVQPHVPVLVVVSCQSVRFRLYLYLYFLFNNSLLFLSTSFRFGAWDSLPDWEDIKNVSDLAEAATQAPAKRESLEELEASVHLL
jgi:hypothetical protein